MSFSLVSSSEKKPENKKPKTKLTDNADVAVRNRSTGAG